MSDTTYEPGIYQDIDGDVIRVDVDGTQTIIAYGTPGWSLGNHIDMDYATKIADLVETAAGDPKPAVLEDGVYRDEDGDVVLVEDGKVIEVLHTGDSYAPWVHLGYYQGNNPDLSDLVRLAAPADDTELPTPTDGFYADKDGDLVQVKGDQMRYLGSSVDLDGWFDLAQEYANFQPYTPLVEVASK